MATVDATLWCVNITGPDDVLAVASRAEAVELAAKFNDLAVTKFEVDPHEYAPLMWAVPTQWPHSAASHAESLGDLGEYGWLRTAPAPAARAVPELLEAAKPIAAVVAALEGLFGFDDDKPVDTQHFGGEFNDFPPLTYGDLRQLTAALAKAGA